ncbi:MAG: peptidase [Geobacteraceae bacterium GWC2_58_44]|nr:MAG: peptidase [Geobacteraceae bacterium GWC2_58_44]HBG05949.1 peptidase [Geobacter sp.]
MPPPDRRTIVVCIGNELIADDAAGFEVYRRLAPIAARLEYCGVGGIDILPLLQGETDLIVVDAVQLGAAPGTVHVMPWDLLPESRAGISAHGLGLREAIEIGRILYAGVIPERVTLVGIEGCCFNLTREFMTWEVARAIDVAVAKVRELVQGGAHG